MTIEFTENVFDYSLFLNIAQVGASIDQRLIVSSQASNTEILNVPFNIGVSNGRYTRIDFTIPTDIPAKHLNSMANYNVTIAGETIDEGILKITTNPGGGTYTQNYISNNETRQAKVYYRPEY